MWFLLFLPVFILLVVLFFIVRRLNKASSRTDRLSSHLASVLESQEIGFSVWDSSEQLRECNAHFQEFYPGVQFKRGLVFEDLIRLTVTCGLVHVPENHIDQWVSDHVNKFRQSTCEVLKTSDGRWLKIKSIRIANDGFLLLYSDITAVREMDFTLSALNNKFQRQSAELKLLQRLIAIGREVDSFELATQQLIDIVCHWSNWPVGFAYSVEGANGGHLKPMKTWHVPPDDLFASLHSLVEQQGISFGDIVMERIAKASDIVWIPNIEVDPVFSNEQRAVMPGIRGACLLPIRSREGEIIAVMEFLAHDQLTPDSSVVGLLQCVSDVLGQVFERHELGQPYSER